jgi:hypothetical protein
MAEPKGRRLPWQVIADIKRQIKGEASEKSERLNQETVDRQSNRLERMWWSQH